MRFSLFVPILLLAASSASYAALGKATSKFDADKGAVTQLRQQTPAIAASTGTAANYVVSDTTLASGTVVREYADLSGRVFAVTWKGRFKPDLKELLGDYFDTMTASVTNAPRANRSRVQVDSAEVVIQSGGHMGAFEGRAWIPAALPADFNLSVLH